MSEFATPSSNEQSVDPSGPAAGDEYAQASGTGYGPPEPTGNAAPTDVTNAVGHYAEDPLNIERKATGLDLIGRAIDVAGYAFGADDLSGRVGSAFAAPGDAVKAAKGIRDGNGSDIVTGGAGVVADVAGALGLTPAAVIAGEAKALNEYETGQDEYGRGLENDNGLMMADGIRHTLDGLADGAGAVPEKHVAGVGKALGFGMAVGDAIAPTLMGDKNVSSDVQKSDGTFVASTGNKWIDRVLGEGKYSESRLHADGLDAEERASPTMGETAHAGVDAGLAKANEEARIKEAAADPAEAARIHANRKKLFEIGMGPDPDA